MKITIAKTAGFCMGVRRAVEMALDASNKSAGPIYSYGPLIHNPQVLQILEEKGITVLDTIPEKGSGIAIIRAHGVPPLEREALIQAGFSILDATCPKVIKVQSIISKHAGEGFAVIIIGDRAHPEVRGLMGYAGNNGYVAETMAEVEALPEFKHAIIVAQTTQNTAFFNAVKSWAGRFHPQYKVFNTICESTENRQDEIKTLAAAVDAVVVVGGYDSGNTRRLYEIAKETQKPVIHIETEADIDIAKLGNARHIGITAGASTPNWIIKRVFREIENLYIHQHHWMKRWAFLIPRNLLLSNIYLAIGAAGLTYASMLLQGMRPGVFPILMALFYLLCMHTFNNLVDITSDRYNDPDRGNFYHKNKTLLWIQAGISGVAGLGVARWMGPMIFLLVICMSVMGVIYIISLGPETIRSGISPRIRNIPGSKTILVALAWGIVTSIAPALYFFGRIQTGTLVVFFWTTCLVFIRTAFFDVLDMQGCRIAGKETIPILIGEENTMNLLKFMAGGAMALISLASVARWVTPLGFLLGLCPLCMFFFLRGYERAGFSPGLGQVLLMESHFVLVGLMACLWAVF